MWQPSPAPPDLRATVLRAMTDASEGHPPPEGTVPFAGATRDELESGFALLATGNFADAVRAFEAAASRDDATAQEFLGMMYLKGEALYPSVPADEQRALHWLRRAAANGSASARCHVDYLDCLAGRARE
jgi:TPR repeat protein